MAPKSQQLEACIKNLISKYSQYLDPSEQLGHNFRKNSERALYYLSLTNTISEQIRFDDPIPQVVIECLPDDIDNLDIVESVTTDSIDEKTPNFLLNYSESDKSLLEQASCFIFEYLGFEGFTQRVENDKDMNKLFKQVEKKHLKNVKFISKFLAVESKLGILVLRHAIDSYDQKNFLNPEKNKILGGLKSLKLL